ncbi:hypothetical protein HK099_001249 [Clydaea vesicula]|uniref:Uncharacterized protein n=1 Tax=Clydaea vesicula TaxID=447962 RepID=A0AAD5TUG0_9FUNG|nr:hypothetical protein HK099_001249 [Clydaea vesicula]
MRISIISFYILSVYTANVIPPIAYVGEKCGGSTFNPPVCSQNSECIYLLGNNVPGASGICVEIFHGVGESCGGGTRAAFQCEAGLTCSNTGVPGQTGTCEEANHPLIPPIAYVGEKCGGSTLNPPVCSQNSECVYLLGNKNIGASGICVEIFHSESEICGGGTRAAFKCKLGLTCDIPPTAPPGTTGICKPYHI